MRSLGQRLAWRILWLAMLAPGWLALAGGVPVVAAQPATPPAHCGSQFCGGPRPGVAIYDCAGVLTPDELASLETRAAAVTRAGAPTVVYLQARVATQDETQQDAQHLMAQWRVGTDATPNDGFVMFFNLDPHDLPHGKAALLAGAQHSNGGNLPDPELQRIFSDVMQPSLSAGRLAEGIAAGLDAVAHDLRDGPPMPWRALVVAQRTAKAFGRLPYNALALLVLLALLALWRRPAPPEGDDAQMALRALGQGRQPPPESVPPGVAGALARGNVRASDMEATVLDFARRGWLALTPERRNRVSVRLLATQPPLTGYQLEVWEALRRQADANGVIPNGRLASVGNQLNQARRTLKDELTRNGWYSPAVERRRRALYAVAIIAFLGFMLGIATAILALEWYPVVGLVLLFVCFVAANQRAVSLSALTPAGEQAAQRWRSYRLDPGDPAGSLPYAVALKQQTAIRKLLGQRAPDVTGQTAYWRNWPALHRALYPTAGDTTSGTSGDGGGGGAGGSF